MDAISVIVTIGGCFVNPIKKHCGYLIHYNSNIKDLIIKIQKLHDKRKGVQFEIAEAERNGRVMAPEVVTWIEKVRNILDEYVDETWIEEVRDNPDQDVVEKWIEKVRNILDEDVEANKMSLGGWCPSYSLSRKAKKKTLEIEGLLSDANQFVTKMSYIPPLGLGIGSSSIEDTMDFESRTKMRKEVLEALKADKINMIAICGMGGIGKTTMAKEVEKRAKDDKLFDEVVIAVVSQTLDLKKIQGQIAEMLGLKFAEEYPPGRAERLKKRLMDSKSVLVILDDVWDALDLKAVGIPHGGQHNRCKILLTSRSEDVCTQMKSQKIFKIEVLSEEEAWNLFREMAGNCVNTTDLRQTAEEVAKECGGLPVAIVTVGRALENKGNDEWIAALQQLKNSIPKNIPGLHSKVYSSIEFSYKYLESDEAKSVFLQCSLFPEDYDIPIEILVRHGVGQRLFAKIVTIVEARNRVYAIVKNLKRSFLLLDSGNGEHYVKMHDVVRDVAISIAENQGFLVRFNKKMEEWPEKDSCEHSTAISLGYEELKWHPDGLECPKLELLQLLCCSDTLQTLPPNLFKGMKGLKVLTLFGMSFPSLPQSINVLQNLRTLQFLSCKITDVSAIGELRKLEILSIIKSQIKKLPGEMRNLSYLKLLDLTGCDHLERIPPDILSNLSHLKELYMLGVDVKWKPMEEEEVDEKEEEEEVDEKEEEEKKGANASLAELKSLSELVALKIDIPNIKVLPKDLTFENKKIEFQIFVGGGEVDRADYLFKNRLDLGSCDVRDIVESSTLFQLLKKSEILQLNEIKDLKNIVYELDNEGFQCLKVLEVAEIDDVEYVLDATSDQNPRAAFPTLESLELVNLPNLKEICHSQFPERSFSGVCFGNLKTLRLRTLPRLIGFCTGVGSIELVQPSLNREVCMILFLSL